MGQISKGVDLVCVKISRVNESPSTRRISQGQILI